MSDRYLLDTNIALYLLGGRLIQPLPIGDFYMSIISEMELLSYPTLSQDEALRIQDFLSQVTLVGLSDEVKTIAIALRKKYRLKLPDAIICGSTGLSMQPTIEDNGASRLSDCLLARKLFTASTSILNPIEPYLRHSVVF